ATADGVVIRPSHQPLRPVELAIPGDFSSAAFWMAAAALRPGWSVIVGDVGLNPTRTAFLALLRSMGADVKVEGPSGDIEPRGMVTVTGQHLGATALAAADVAAAIDEIPVLLVLATQAEGVTTIDGAGELRVKESDRIAAMADGLRHMGAVIVERPDGVSVKGSTVLRGANVTIPHKESVLAFLDDLDPLAARIGAVNTISRAGTRLKGWNTDVEGFRHALAEMGGDYDRVAIIGAGGAARAVAAALQPAAEIWVIARNLDQARRLCRDLEILRGGPVQVDQMEQTVARVQLVVNATPADLPPPAWLRADQRLFDLRSRRSPEGR